MVVIRRWHPEISMRRPNLGLEQEQEHELVRMEIVRQPLQCRYEHYYPHWRIERIVLVHLIVKTNNCWSHWRRPQRSSHCQLHLRPAELKPLPWQYSWLECAQSRWVDEVFHEESDYVASHQVCRCEQSPKCSAAVSKGWWKKRVYINWYVSDEPMQSMMTMRWNITLRSNCKSLTKDRNFVWLKNMGARLSIMASLSWIMNSLPSAVHEMQEPNSESHAYSSML